MVMMILVVVSILGVAGVQLALMSEKGARNDRDMQMAWQSAEAALQDSEFDMRGPGTSTRQGTFANNTKSEFLPGCGSASSGNSKGLCTPSAFGKAVWLTTDFAASNSPTAEFGDFTGRAFDAGSTGIRSAKKPRYMIEVLDDPEAFGDLSIGKKKYVYRVTAMGFGPRDDIQAVMQMIFRKE
jgi:type IV pilus assembly protein PilX